jgi:hypothetical protein
MRETGEVQCGILLSRRLQCGSVTSLGMLSLGLLLESVTAVGVTGNGTAHCDGVWMTVRLHVQHGTLLAILSVGGSTGTGDCDERVWLIWGHGMVWLIAMAMSGNAMQPIAMRNGIVGGMGDAWGLGAVPVPGTGS